MIKQHILDEIRRTAQANRGVPLGRDRFSQETGIKELDWFGKYWARWGDALREAGFAPNKLQGAYSEDEVFQRLIGLIGCQVNFIKSESASGEAGDRGGIYVGTSAVDEAYERLAARGAQCLSAPGDREYGMRDFVALDLNGYRVCFGRPTVE